MAKEQEQKLEEPFSIDRQTGDLLIHFIIPPDKGNTGSLAVGLLRKVRISYDPDHPEQGIQMRVPSKFKLTEQ